jgi:hypothetical protein
MPLKDYLATLQSLLAETPFVTSTTLNYEERPPTAAIIKGTLLFTDGSQLDFRDFLITQPALQVVRYAYNYRRGELLIFPYDDANDPAARHLSTYPSHKHLPQGILVAQQPSLGQVLQEITSRLKF